jgi:Fe-S-cluster containining protein
MSQEDSFINDLDGAFFTEGYSIAKKNLEGNLTKDGLFSLCQDIYSHIEEFLDLFLQQCNAMEYEVACEKKCTYCCHQSVFVLPYEAFYMHITLISEDGEEITNDVIDKNKRTKQLSAQKLVFNKETCPFLKDGLCLRYDSRPMGCRLHYSMDKLSCKSDYEQPENPECYPMLYEIPLRAGRMLNAGVCEFFKDQGIKIEEWTLEWYLSLFKNDETLIDKWLSGNYEFKLPSLSKDEKEFLDNLNIAASE